MQFECSSVTGTVPEEPVQQLCKPNTLHAASKLAINAPSCGCVSPLCCTIGRRVPAALLAVRGFKLGM